MNIVIVEDEKLLLGEMLYVVKQAAPNANIDAFLDSEDVLVAAQTMKYDVAFLDIQMPKIDGVTLACRLKDINPQINIVFATSYSEYTVDAISIHASGYLKKPVTVEDVSRELDNLLYPITKAEPRIEITTFGNFCVFADGKPVPFRRSPEMELLAYLVDRHGAAITRKEVAAVLFEDTDFGRGQQVYLSAIAHDLAEDLANVGAPDLFQKQAGKYYVDVSKFSCDSYDFLDGKPKARARFAGEYMEQYSWAEYQKGKFEAEPKN